MMRDHQMPEATQCDLDEFFVEATQREWERRLSLGALEADAVVRLAQDYDPKFSSGILIALGQETFRQISTGNVDPGAMGRLAHLFLKARSDERSSEMHELKQEKLRRELQGQIDHALERLCEEVDSHPEAREAFVALREELAHMMDKASEAEAEAKIAAAKEATP
jgi:hypothetical protein